MDVLLLRAPHERIRGGLSVSPVSLARSLPACADVVERSSLSSVPQAALDLLKVPSDFLPYLLHNHPEEHRALFDHGPLLRNHFVDSRGLVFDQDALEVIATACDDCWTALDKEKLPKLSLANGLWTGPVPDVLACLTDAEQLAIGITRSSMRSLFFLRSHPTDDKSTQQRASKGHWLSFPQYLGDLVTSVQSLPHPPTELARMVHIALVGPPPYDEAALRSTFAVDRLKIRAAFDWLSTRNELYRGIGWDSSTADLYDGKVPDSLARTEIPDAEAEGAERAACTSYDDGDDDDDSGSESDWEEPEISASGVVDLNGLGPSATEREVGGLRNVARGLGSDGHHAAVDDEEMEADVSDISSPSILSVALIL